MQASASKATSNGKLNDVSFNGSALFFFNEPTQHLGFNSSYSAHSFFYFLQSELGAAFTHFFMQCLYFLQVTESVLSAAI